MRSVTKEFFENISKLDREQYFNCFLTYMLSPVIMETKPSMTISIAPKDMRAFKNWVSRLNNGDIMHTELKSANEKIVMIIYSVKALNAQLEKFENRKILDSLGYVRNSTLDEKIERLKLRMTLDDFPHEIGIFLGIPARDVMGFIKGEKCIHCGYWKVYGNLSEAKKTFGLYDLSKNLAMESILDGKNIDDTLSIIRSFRGQECSIQ